MTRRLATLSIVAALTAFAPTSAVSATAAPVASAACTYGVIGGKSKCLARGEFCAVRYARQYLRYGFSCTKVDRNGRYHLQ